MHTLRSRFSKPKPVPFWVVTEVKAEDVDDAMIQAIDGGSDWIKTVYPDYNSKTTKQIIAGTQDLLVEDKDGRKRILNRSSISRGLKLMASNHPGAFADMAVLSNVETGDILLQLALFGEVIYE